MKLMLKARAWNAFLNGVRVFVHPAFDVMGGEKEEETDGKHLKKDDGEENTISAPPVESYNAIDKDSWSIPEGFVLRKPVYLYMKVSRDGGYWEVPLPAGSILHMSAFRKPEFMIEHPVTKRFDDEGEGDNN